MTRSLLRNRGVRLLTRAVRINAATSWVFANHDRREWTVFNKLP